MKSRRLPTETGGGASCAGRPGSPMSGSRPRAPDLGNIDADAAARVGSMKEYAKPQPLTHVSPGAGLLWIGLLLLSACGSGRGTVPAVRPTDVLAAPTQPTVEAVRMAVLRLTNEARLQAGIAPLRGDAQLDSIAQLHARDMDERGFYAHESPDGKSLLARLLDSGAPFREAAENIAEDRTPSDAVRSWLYSTGHRRNLLDPAYGRMGVGVYRQKSGRYTYYVQVFAN